MIYSKFLLYFNITKYDACKEALQIDIYRNVKIMIYLKIN